MLRPLTKHGKIAEHLNGIAVAMEAAKDDTPILKVLTIPKAMRIWSVAAANRVAFLPGLSEVALEHPAIPAAAGAAVRVCSMLLCLVKQLQSLLYFLKRDAVFSLY
jgi:hypothetical protein